MAWIAGVNYFNQATESDDDYSNENNQEEVNNESNNQEEGKQDTKDDNHVVDMTDNVIPNDIEIDHLSNQQDIQENDPIQDESVSATSNDHDDNCEEEKPQLMDNLQRSTRVIQPPSHYIPSFKGKSYAQAVNINQGMLYSQQEAKVVAMIMCQFNERMSIQKTQYKVQFIVTYSLKQGKQKFGDEA